jgi:hypothetical protein
MSTNPTYSSERQRTRATRHGCRYHPLYAVWLSMIQRCHNPRDRAYSQYGARGVSMCAEWRDDPAAFIRWALAHGWRKRLTLDRIDNEGPYTPGNCRFVSYTVNGRNRRNTVRVCFRGEDVPLAEAVERCGAVSYTRAWKRIFTYGWPVERAITTPAQRRGG